MNSNNGDYYKILGISSEASADEIKKAYRRLALETHPDRNPGDASAEERFKKISEAYAVLADPQKRAQYDQYRRLGFYDRPGTAGAGAGARTRPGFGYSQEEIFRDFFTNRYAQDIFQDMQREFQRMGFRFDERFINNIFFGGGNTFFQGFFWSGPGGVRVFRYGDFAGAKSGHAGPAQEAAKKPEPRGLVQTGLSLLAKAGKKIGGFLLGKALGVDDRKNPAVSGSAGGYAKGDVTYDLQISTGEAATGVIVQVELPHIDGGKRVSVRVPPGVRSGTRLRLKAMGQNTPNRTGDRGDLYINLRVV